MIRINPPVPPPTLEGPAIVHALLHRARAEGIAPHPDDIRALVEYRNPNGTSRAMHAMHLLVKAIIETPAPAPSAPRSPPPPPKSTPAQMAEAAVRALQQRSVRAPLTWPEIRAIIQQAVS